jgi:predicted nuclease of restriction endonuclease-like (RecB) superfamily
MKVTSKLLMVMVEVPVQVGELKCKAEMQVCRTLGHLENANEGEDDIDFADISDITYMGIPIEGYANFKKFKQFHLEMGIDWNLAIRNKLEEMQDEITELVNASC